MKTTQDTTTRDAATDDTPKAVGEPASSRSWVWPLTATLGIQTTSAFLSRLVPTLAPILMASTGLPEQAIGYMSALSTAGSMVFLTSGSADPPVWTDPTLQAGPPLGGVGLGLLVCRNG